MRAAMALLRSFRCDNGSVGVLRTKPPTHSRSQRLLPRHCGMAGSATAIGKAGPACALNVTVARLDDDGVGGCQKMRDRGRSARHIVGPVDPCRRCHVQIKAVTSKVARLPRAQHQAARAGNDRGAVEIGSDMTDRHTGDGRTLARPVGRTTPCLLRVRRQRGAPHCAGLALRTDAFPESLTQEDRPAAQTWAVCGHVAGARCRGRGKLQVRSHVFSS